MLFLFLIVSMLDPDEKGSNLLRLIHVVLIKWFVLLLGEALWLEDFGNEL